MKSAICLLFLLWTATICKGGEIVVELTQSFTPLDLAHRLKLVSHRTPDSPIEGIVESKTKMRFSNLKPGVYDVVLWGGIGWLASPVADRTVRIREEQTVERLINFDAPAPAHKIDVLTQQLLQEHFRQFAAVPCKLQRLDHQHKAVPFGYRWRWMAPEKPGHYSVEGNFVEGDYLLIVPSLPYDPATGEPVEKEPLLEVSLKLENKKKAARVEVPQASGSSTGVRNGSK